MIRVVLLIGLALLLARVLSERKSRRAGLSPGGARAGGRPRFGRLRPGGSTARGDAAGQLSTPVRLELIAAMLDAGLPLSAAIGELGRAEGHARLTRVAERLRWGLRWEQAWQIPDPHPPPGGSKHGEERELAELREALGFAARSGAPAARMLRAQSARVRRRRHREAEARAAALGVRLMLPLGLCSLPAFIALGVVPVLIGLVPALW